MENSLQKKMQPSYQPLPTSESGGSPSMMSKVEQAWQKASVIEFNGTRIETPFAKMNPSSIKWYFIGSLILWSLIFFGCYKAWTTTVRPYIWGPYEDKPPISIDPSLLEEQKHQTNQEQIDNQQKTVVRRPVRRKSQGGILENILPPRVL